MSRIGKIPVAVPKEVKVGIDKSAVTLEGGKGKEHENNKYPEDQKAGFGTQ